MLVYTIINYELEITNYGVGRQAHLLDVGATLAVAQCLPSMRATARVAPTGGCPIPAIHKGLSQKSKTYNFIAPTIRSDGGEIVKNALLRQPPTGGCGKCGAANFNNH